MIHPDILLIFAKQRQRELWDEAVQAQRVRQLKTATKRLPSSNSLLSGERVTAYNHWHDALQKARTSRTQHKRVA